MNFNISPYFNDYSPNKDFYSILFKPSVGVQVRELNQLQTILQNQITQFGNNIFQNGSMVVPGGVTYNASYAYVNVNSFTGSVSVNSFLPNLVGQSIVGQTSGVIAQVVGAQASDGFSTLFVQYTSGANSAGSTGANMFLPGELLVPSNTLISAYTTQIASTATNGINPVGFGASISVARGIYFVNGYFVTVEPQTIVLSSFTTTPTCSVGFLVEENVVTSVQDNSLFDNAQGTPNYTAPGADRYQIVLTLTSIQSGTPQPSNFIQITAFSNGVQIYPDSSSNYSLINDMIASRTYDEAGNYTVQKFPITIKEYRNNARGAWQASTVYLAGDVVNTNWTALYNGTSGSTPPTFNQSSGIVLDNSVEWIYTALPYTNNGAYVPSVTDTLLVATANESNFIASLGAGKAYVDGYQLQKIASTPLTIPKARTTNYIGNAIVNPEYDNYILITDVSTLVDFTQLPTVTLYDAMNLVSGTPNGNVIGTAIVLNVTYYSGTPGTSSAVYRASLGSVSLNANVNFNRQVKQIYVSGMTANILPVTSLLSGSISCTGTSTVTGVGTLFLTQLNVGDWIQVNSVNYEVTAIASNYSLTINASPTFAGANAYLIQTSLVNSANDALIFPLGNPFVSTVRNVGGAISTSYNVVQSFASNIASSSAFTVTVKNTSTDIFSPTTNTENYITVNTTTNSIVNPTYSLNGNSQQLTASGLVTGDTYTLFANVTRSGTGTEKTKTLSVNTATISASGIATLPVVPLPEADGYTLISVKMDSGTFASPTGSYLIDITSRYSFDNGQRNSHYAPSSIVLNSGAPVPVAPIQIVFTYFQHSSTGDYFTANSYLGAIDYSFIPSYSGVLLSDVIDFRSRIDVVGNAPTIINGFPAVGYDLSTAYSYYQGRDDIITLDNTGTFTDVSGSPSDNPQLPSVPSGVMPIYNLHISQYVNSVNNGSVTYTEVDNAVYTMSDIAVLDQRISNLEYYTSLSLLEQNTLNLPLTDANGLPLYKNGIAVDNFNGANSIGDVANIDYMCSMDTTSGALRPFYTMSSNQLVEQSTSDVQRLSAGYARNGNLLTLPFTSTPFITQSLGTNAINLNPFAIFGFIGAMQITPSSDDWFSTTYIPNQVVQVVDNYSAMNALLQASGVLGTQWNAWQTTWSGTTNTASLGNYLLNSGSTSGSLSFNNQGYYGNGNIGVGGMAGLANMYGDTAIAYNPNAPQNITITGAQANSIYNAHYTAASWKHGTFQLEATTTTTNQTATGIQTTLVPQTSDQIVGTNVISQVAIPYMRQRHVYVKCTGLKPATQYYAYFDDVNVTSSFTTAIKLDISPISGHSSTFNTTTDIASAATGVSARMIPGDSVMVLSTGDVITGQTSGATGILVGQEYNIATSTTELYVINVIGTFSANETIVGSISTSSATLTSITNSNGIVPTENGNVYGLLLIQNTPSLAFQCGVVGFVLSDNSSSSNTASADSYAFAQYSATGILETKQNNVVATTTGQIVQTAVTENQTIYSSGITANFLGYGDPVAQSFLITQSTGLFVTGIDVYFSTADSSVPVTLQIVDMVNGTPGQTIVPNSVVVLDASSITTTSNGLTPTHFQFPAPVYLSGNTEYAVEIISNSNNYNVFVATMGQQDLITGQFVSTQPYAGMLFESKNSSTWIPNANSTLKFVLYSAEFSTNVSTFNLVNTLPGGTTLPINPFTSVNGSTTITVMFISHGLSNGSIVTISGAIAGNGVPALNGNFTVENCTLDTFTITTSAATSSGTFGGSAVIAYGNIQYDTCMLSAQELNFSGTSTSYGLKTTSGKSINGTETPYVTASQFMSITNGANVPLSHTALIANSANAIGSMGNAPSAYVQVTMQSNNSYLSPVIDMSRVSLTLIQNKVNYPTSNNETVPTGSSTYSKFVTTPIKLANAADNLHVMFGYNMFPGNNILVYYKTSLSSSGTNIAQESYTLFTPDIALSPNSTNSFTDASYTATGLLAFDTLVVKIVLQSTNEAQVPLVNALRIVCTS